MDLPTTKTGTAKTFDEEEEYDLMEDVVVARYTQTTTTTKLQTIASTYIYIFALRLLDRSFYFNNLV